MLMNSPQKELVLHRRMEVVIEGVALPMVAILATILLILDHAFKTSQYWDDFPSGWDGPHLPHARNRHH